MSSKSFDWNQVFPSKKAAKYNDSENYEFLNIVAKEYNKRFQKPILEDREEESIIGNPDVAKIPHYQGDKLECIDCISQAVTGKDGHEGYLVGNVIKYLWRYEKKGGIEDVRKAVDYGKRLLIYLEDRDK